MLTAFVRLVVYAGLVALAYYHTYADVASGTYLDDNWTEAPQEISLLISGIITAYVAYRFTAWRPLFVALSGLAFASLIREFNNDIAAVLGKGTWLYFSLAVAVPAAIYALRNFRAFWRQLDAVGGTFAFGVWSSGVLVLHVFSRMYGANPLWRAAMGEDFDRQIARISEEGIELLGYTLMFLGTLELCRVATQQRSMLAETTQRGAS